MNRPSFHPLAFLLVVAALGLSCRERAIEIPADREETPVFIISIDTLRSDRLPAYGYGNGRTPALDAFRRDSVLFAHAFSHAPTTFPSHASLLTGLLPPRHGVRDNIGYALAGSHETVATMLADSGYATGAAVSSYVLRRSTGIASGFSFFDDAFEYDKGNSRTSAERDGDKTRLALESWLAGTTGRKVFGFLHLYEPHAPYAPPPEFTDTATPYDGEVSYADSVVGRFLEALRQRGLYDDALIIVLSDHGEGLGDHGEDEHGVFLYRESLQVPLLIKLPRGRMKGTTDDSVAGLVDVLPTLLNVAGVKPSSPLDGRDLFGKTAAPVLYAETYYPRLHFGWSELRAAIGPRFHFIEAPQKELYDYRADPGESRNAIDQNRREAFDLARHLAAVPANFSEPSAIDPEDQRKLAALGYIGSTRGGRGPLPDPKSKIDAVRQLSLGFDLVARQEFRKGASHLRPFVKDNPDIIDGWWLLGRSLARSGREEEALRALKEGAQRFPGNASILLATADVLFSMDRHGEARAHAELAVKDEPVRAREFLAMMDLRRGDLGSAEREIRAALEAAPTRTDTLVLLADILRKQNRRAEELAVLEQARLGIEQRKLAPVGNLHFHRGEALLQQGRVPDAEAAFRSETRDFPSNRQAWASLALVVGAQGRRDEAREILMEGLQKNPDAKMRALAVESFEVMGDAEGARMVQRQSRGGRPLR